MKRGKREKQEKGERMKLARTVERGRKMKKERNRKEKCLLWKAGERKQGSEGK